MRIAQVAPLYESVPPKFYGGTERVVSFLTEELVKMGNDVTLFASGDSSTRARLVPVCSESLRLSKNCSDSIVHHVLQVEKVFKHVHNFDLIHFHIDYLPFSMIRYHPEVACITTLHGRMDIKDLFPLYREFFEISLVSVSDAQRLPVSGANWIATVYHGIPENLYKFYEKSGEYLAFLGRVSPEKGLDSAIEIAKKSDMPLKIAAKIDECNTDYFENIIRKLIDTPMIEYIGEISEKEKNEFLGKAYALLFPINWPEPFGLVMIESMSCGTPVIAFPYGSVPEIMIEGKTGYMVEGVRDAVKALRLIEKFDRKACRRIFEINFTSARMAKDYINIYTRIINNEIPAFLPALLKKRIS
jgi:glycosyltransferase involved in cell wall biosynthesis